MSRVFFTSDLHFGHKNLIEGLRNMSVEESDMLVIENWNKVIKKRDTVYILGDIVMEKPLYACAYLPRLNGNICIVGGNHDTKICCETYAKMGIPVMGVLEYKGFLCTHIPVHPTQIEHFRGNIHGHIHLSGDIEGLGRYNAPLVEGRYYNVNTEFHNYTPVLFDDIVSWFEKNKFHENM